MDYESFRLSILAKGLIGFLLILKGLPVGFGRKTLPNLPDLPNYDKPRVGFMVGIANPASSFFPLLVPLLFSFAVNFRGRRRRFGRCPDR